MIHYYKYKDQVAEEWKDITHFTGLVTCPTCKNMIAQDCRKENEHIEKEVSKMRVHYYELRNECPHCELPNTVYEDRVTCPKCIELMSKHKEEPMTKTYYLVMIDAADMPRHRYDSFDDAVNAAERLLSKEENQYKGATILQALTYGKAQYTPVSWTNLRT